MNHKIQPSQKNPYHYGAISAIVGCILSLLNIIEWHWFFILTVFYGCGVGYFFIKASWLDQSIEHHERTRIPPPPLPVVEELKPQVEAVPPPLDNTHQYSRLFQDYEQLQQHSISFLNANSQHSMIEIQKIMHFMQQKLNQQPDDHFKFEIMDIQRTLNAYLIPALQHFSDLPPFLRERKIIDQQSPSQLLEQQLLMILNEFQNIAESIYMNDLNKLIDHGQYLKYKLTQQDSFSVHPSADQPH